MNRLKRSKLNYNLKQNKSITVLPGTYVNIKHHVGTFVTFVFIYTYQPGL